MPEISGKKVLFPRTREQKLDNELYLTQHEVFFLKEEIISLHKTVRKNEMNEQELRELLAEQASVIHELRRDAEGMTAIIADLRGRVKHKPRPVLPRIEDMAKDVDRFVEQHLAAAGWGEFVALNGSIKEEYLSRRFDHEEGQEQ